jgi:catechol 2,3-dioxygenase-like lactoylglutathione lyase family enzyme
VVRGIHHVGLAVSSAKGATRFYEGAFGFRELSSLRWRAADMRRLCGLPDGEDAALAVAAPNLLIALIEVQGTTARSRPRSVTSPGITHLCVQSADMGDLQAAATRAGASFHAQPTDLGGDILYAYPRDPEGNVLELESLPWAATERGAWPAHVSITTPDLDRAVPFYEQLLGAAARRSPRMGPNAKIDLLTGMSGVEVSGAWISVGNLQLELLEYHHPAAAREESPLGYRYIAFEASSLEACRSSDAGRAQAWEEVMLTDGTAAIFGRDADGNRIACVIPDNTMPRISDFADAGIVARVEAALAAVLA